MKLIEKDIIINNERNRKTNQVVNAQSCGKECAPAGWYNELSQKTRFQSVPYM